MKDEKNKAVIFDLDGTLLNTLKDIADSANEALDRYGLPPHPVDAYRYFVGDGVATLMKRVMPADSTDDVIVESIERFKSNYEQRWHNKTRPYPGIMDMLAYLQHSGVKMAILSNKPDNFTQKCVKLFFPKILFHVVSGKKDDVPPKPDPFSTLSIIDTLDVAPGRTLFVGDSSVDMKTGVAAGISAIGVDWGFRTKTELKQAGADRVVGSPEELINYVTQL